jgi:hypothetical protein
VARHPNSHYNSRVLRAEQYDAQLAATAQSGLMFNPDTGHIIRGGQDPVECFRRYRSRIVNVHRPGCKGARLMKEKHHVLGGRCWKSSSDRFSASPRRCATSSRSSGCPRISAGSRSSTPRSAPDAACASARPAQAITISKIGEKKFEASIDPRLLRLLRAVRRDLPAEGHRHLHRFRARAARTGKAEGGLPCRSRIWFLP